MKTMKLLTALIPALLLTACSMSGKLIRMEDGSGISVKVTQEMSGRIKIEGQAESGEKYFGEARELQTDKMTTRLENDTLKLAGHIYYGSGYLRSADRKVVINFEYQREQTGRGVGSGTDNQGRNYQLLF